MFRCLQFACVISLPVVLITYLFPCKVCLKVSLVGIIYLFSPKHTYFLWTFQIEKIGYWQKPIPYKSLAAEEASFLPFPIDSRKLYLLQIFANPINHLSLGFLVYRCDFCLSWGYLFRFFNGKQSAGICGTLAWLELDEDTCTIQGDVDFLLSLWLLVGGAGAGLLIIRS